MYNIKIKTYYDGRKVFILSEKPIVATERPLKKKGRVAEKEIDFTDCIPDDEILQNRQLDNERRSVTRTKQAIFDVAHNNPWEYFLTVTFDSAKVDRYNYEEVRKKYIKLLSNLKQRKCPNMEYIFVPEQHKDGAIHFHGLIHSADGLTLVDSGKRDRKNRVIYNAPDFSLGFNTITKIGDPSKAGTYISKYITKDTNELTGKKYWISKGLNQVEIEKMLVSDEMKNELEQQLINNVDFAGIRISKIETSSYSNTFTYIVTHKPSN